MIPKLQNRIVLDTNVCLDLFVFRDPGSEALLAMLRSGAIQAVTRTDCRAEWMIVLGYGKLGLDAAAQAAALADFDSLSALLTPDTSALPPLPSCKDPDDQKFLELAAQAGAQALLTKDKALLKLAGRMRRLTGVNVLTPARWLTLQCDLPAQLPELQ